MSAPALEASSAALLLLAAFGGSPHCAAMCGPLRLLVAARSGVAYQLGRGLAYSLLGALAGFLGWSVPPWALLAFTLAAVAAILLRARAPALGGALRGRLLGAAASHPVLLGFSSGLLPCGLLHAWVLAAAVTASPARGALVLFSLWLGTLPALEVGSRALAVPLAKARRAFPRTMTLALLLLAAAPAAWRARAAFLPATEASCHAGAGSEHHAE